MEKCFLQTDEMKEGSRYDKGGLAGACTAERKEWVYEERTGKDNQEGGKGMYGRTREEEPFQGRMGLRRLQKKAAGNIENKMIFVIIRGDRGETV